MPWISAILFYSDNRRQHAGAANPHGLSWSARDAPAPMPLLPVRVGCN